MERLGFTKPEILPPRIIIVGDQSAGKNSLIKVIFEIKVPRSLKIYIKCPLNITITANNKLNIS